MERVGRVVRQYFPIVRWLPTYERSWLAEDAAAGLSVWALLIPQGLAYAAIAGVPVQYGLYTAFAALLAYAIFGSSKQVIAGPSATVAAVTATVVTPLVGAAAMGTDAAVPYVAALALATGVLYLALGIGHMGWVSNFLSKAVMTGFVVGFAIGIIIDQSHKLLGVPSVSGTYMQILKGTIQELPDTSMVTLAVGAGSLGLLLLLRHLKPRWPRALMVMAVSIAAVQVLDLASHGVAVTGHVPTGLFTVGLPGIGWSDSGTLLLGGLAVIFVGFSESLASARMTSVRHGYDISPNQELIAQGAAAGAAGMVGGFAVAGSLSKTTVADTAGQRTQMASLINAAFVLMTMLFLASLFEDLASATLGAVVIDAMLGLIDVEPLKRYYKVNRSDWVFAMGALLGILFIGIIGGIMIGVVLSLLLLIARSANPKLRVMGRDPKSDAYFDLDRETDLELESGLLIVRLDGPLFFADAEPFRDEVNALLHSADEPVQGIVLDADAIALSDTDGADILIQMHGELAQAGVGLALSRVEPAVLHLWSDAGAIDAIGTDHVFDTTRAAVDARDAWTVPAPSTPDGPR